MIPDRIPVPTPLGHGRCRVESDTQPGQVYDVDATIPGHCTCPGFAFRGSCKHLDRLQDIEQRQAAAQVGLRRDIAAYRRQRIKSVDLDTCQSCHSRPAAAGHAECSPCLMGQLQAAFGCAS